MSTVRHSTIHMVSSDGTTIRDFTYASLGSLIASAANITPFSSTATVTTSLPSGSNVASGGVTVSNVTQNGPNVANFSTTRFTLAVTPSNASNLCQVNLALPGRTTNYSTVADVFYQVSGVDASNNKISNDILTSTVSSALCALTFQPNNTGVHYIHLETTYLAI